MFFTFEKAEFQYSLVCSCSLTKVVDVIPTFEEAVNLARITPSTCEDDYCVESPVEIELVEIDAHRVELSNFHSELVLDVLGLSDDSERDMGIMEPDVFLGRVLLAELLSEADDLAEGFNLPDTLIRLKVMAEAAKTVNSCVTWY